jgi:NTE family protein
MGQRSQIDALVLSAGGLFAAYQAGVLKALWPFWKPDIVVGTSAGALNAWLVAGGAGPDELIERWVHPDAGRAIKFRNSRDLWNGYFDPAPLLEQTRRIHRDFPRKLPLGVVSIEVPQFRPRLFRNDEITPEQLLATCSILLFYPWVRINGRRLVDGGLFEPMPLWAAAAMGATRVVAINALPRITPWAIHLVLSGMHRVRKMPVPHDLDISVISPSGAMGTARDSMVWEKDHVERWVEMGMRDGEAFVKKNIAGLKPLAR